MKEKNLFEAIMAHLFGHKYYAVIVNRKGTLGCFICDAIYADKEAAKAKEQELVFNNSFQYIETISFRSRINYTYKVNNKNKITEYVHNQIH